MPFLPPLTEGCPGAAVAAGNHPLVLQLCCQHPQIRINQTTRKERAEGVLVSAPPMPWPCGWCPPTAGRSPHLSLCFSLCFSAELLGCFAPSLGQLGKSSPFSFFSFSPSVSFSFFGVVEGSGGRIWVSEAWPKPVQGTWGAASQGGGMAGGMLSP